jgi:hypothetical protein
MNRIISRSIDSWVKQPYNDPLAVIRALCASEGLVSYTLSLHDKLRGKSGPVLKLIGEALRAECVVLCRRGSFFRAGSLTPDTEDSEAIYVLGEDVLCRQEQNSSTEAITYVLAFSGRLPTDEELDRLYQVQKLLLPATKPQDSQIGILSAGDGGLKVVKRPFPRRELLEDNYTPAVVAGFKRLIGVLEQPNSSHGRLTILQGPPGVGKTMFLRAMIGSLPPDSGVSCLYVPMQVAANMSSPNFVSFLLEQSRYTRLALLVEDGDVLLEKRKTGHSEVTDFLNMVDGLLGEALNLHIIVTSNLQRAEFDPAIIRPGRLDTIMTFSRISQAQAQKVADRETDQALTLSTQRDWSLAEIYAAILEHDNGFKAKVGETGQYL